MRRIDRPYHHAFLPSRKLWFVGGLCRRGPMPVAFLAAHHRPGDARGLVGQSHRNDQARPAAVKPDDPRIGVGRLGAQQIGAGAVNQQTSLVPLAALGDAAQARLATGRVLSWHQTQPRGELATAGKVDRLHNRRG